MFQLNECFVVLKLHTNGLAFRHYDKGKNLWIQGTMRVS